MQQLADAATAEKANVKSLRATLTTIKLEVEERTARIGTLAEQEEVRVNHPLPPHPGSY